MSTVVTEIEAPAAVSYTFTSESVSEGHPDKVCDFIADSILDAHLAQDPASRVACEVLVKEDNVVLAGEITSSVTVDYEQVVRQAIREIGYVDADQPFHADTVKIISFLSAQAAEIAQGVDEDTSESGEQGAGDQGIMFGYATAETPELMPLPILLSHRLARSLAAHRKGGTVDWLRPDSKTQVSVVYEGNTPVAVTDVLVSTQHAASVSRDEIRHLVATTIIPEALGHWYHDDLRIMVNPTGSFVQGGPSADAGVTGRKIIVDTYGGMGRHGGGAFSGKDPSKVDRSGAYFCRFVAREIVKAGLAQRAEVQVAYAIGVAQPVSVKVDTFGTGDARAAAEYVRENFDFRPGAIIQRLDLLQPIYRKTTNYGHFGKAELPWEQ
ncbi:MAG TPA: methionine adenosyltransferase [Longimicrobium sp.]|jgi:S-adenosylmethionine synthetase|uniref:methionine adenosyltransferase n=1 Tax=Longimicrobium sp. TaxID=2029185 RepID=UPI002ED924AD